MSVSIVTITEGSSTLLNSLIAYWKLDETSGTTIYDAHTSSLNGTTTGATNATGILGKAVDLDLAEVITITYNSALIPTGEEFSISMWIKLDILATEGNSVYLIRFLDTTNGSTHIAWIASDDGDRIYFYVNTTNGEISSGSSIQLNSKVIWYHIVMVCPSVGNPLKIYVNNASTMSWANNMTGTLTSSDGVLRLGNYSDGSYGLDGLMDEVGLWNRALTSDEVAELYNSGVGKTYPFN